MPFDAKALDLGLTLGVGKYSPTTFLYVGKRIIFKKNVASMLK